jgi:hypothetical protein
VVEGDEYLVPVSVPLPGGVVVDERVEPERVTIHTNRVGHPLLVKISYHPRWKATGARGPYLVSPSLMLVVPEQETVVLEYARTAADRVGLVLTLGALGFAAWWRWGRRPVVSRARLSLAALACDTEVGEPRRWGGAIPVALMAALLIARLSMVWVSGRGEKTAIRLHEFASRAYQEERYDAAVEYLRGALDAHPAKELKRSLLALRAESFQNLGRRTDARRDWRALLAEAPSGPYSPQALFGLIAATPEPDRSTEALDAARRLVREYPENPWTLRLQAEYGALVRRATPDP